MQPYRRKAALIIADTIIVSVCLYISLLLRFEWQIPNHYYNIFIHSVIIITFLKISLFMIYGLYTSLWKYASIDELVQIFLAVSTASFAEYIFGMIMKMQQPNSVYLINAMLTLFLIGLSRMSYRLIRRVKHAYLPCQVKQKRVLIVGAGQAGSMVIKEMKENPELGYVPAAVVDDDRTKIRTSIHGVPVLGGRDKILSAVIQKDIEEIIIALPSAPKSEIREMIEICKKTKCKLKTLPGVYELIDGKVSLKMIRDVNIEDLLGRDEVKLHTEQIAQYIKDETILITGGGGSIGSELCRQLAKFQPKTLIIYDIYENNAYVLEHELKNQYAHEIDIEVAIGSIRDKDRLRQVFSRHKPGVIFHAAAHKHVPLMELNATEAVKNNIFGTLNVVQVSDEYGVKKFVLISTDKAVNPTNIMGATKRFAEMIVQTMDKRSKTEFAAVRFGNVLGSNGSVIPLFKNQIAQGGPVTVTHPQITRYFMTIPEAAQLVIQAGAIAKGGEIFILDMGQSIKILDLARDLIRLSGFEPDKDIKIEFIGLRPGEKLYEELMLKEEGVKSTSHENIFVGKPLDLSFNEIMMGIRVLQNSLNSPEKLKQCMKTIVSTYATAADEVAAGDER
ncbi:MAG: polysaccharide biosynthesis protein [Clostridiales bacterium]|nr:polysaccharide biosynthesis protein [Clostridiales bacterium]